MIGFYNYSVILTYISLVSSLFGMMLTVNNHYKLAVLFLAISGLCDMFDGKIARAMKNRTEDEKKFGIQIDSLCDVICFGAFPIILCYKLGMSNPIGIIFLMIYGVASVIRLGFFNVMEEQRQEETDSNRKYYQGLPITSIAVALPILYVTRSFLKGDFIILLHIVIIAIGVLFITNFKFKKPHNITLAAIVVIVSIALANTFWFHWIH
ncbi:CDP-alcohol phosphatidyltransferase family protein [[Clostridium] fimetarium]|uniref:CDP-diacylglycerol---serine O-phosphatidyltransferase n=1 Tax=[Clostridium] fimetarium TaxID=99656 RepID=A0A1I0R1K1_9FIRM|nr:CDP-alcohol phosphatidyltransferase family protein [[Clostridium] fimetarium]SEW34311.1 CDP-diacylglycerol---serine O-phosphatidyltransferase [[Clostridium] fimetarium]